MNLKLLGSLVMAVALSLAGCQKGSNQKEGNDKGQAPVQQEQPAAEQQQMPGQMQQAADIEVSEAEVNKFVAAAIKVQSINQGIRKEMNQAVQEGDMDAQRFNEIQRAKQTQQGEADMTEKEMKQYSTIMEELQNIQSGAQQDMQKAIKDAGLSMQRYQQIATAAQRDTALMKRIQTKLQGRMQQR